MSITVKRFRDVFLDPHKADPVRIVPWEIGATVADYLPDGFDRSRVCYVALDGRPLTGAEVDDTIPQDGAEIVCGDVPGLLGALIPGIAAGSFAAVAVAIADFVIISALSIGISYGIAALNAPAKIPSYGLDEGPTRNFQGIQDTAGAGNPIPFVYGRHRMGGQFLQSFERLVEGEDVPDGVTTIYTLMGVAIGPLNSISEIQVDGTPISVDSGISWESRLGTTDQAPIFPFGEQIVHEIIHAKAIRYDDEDPQVYVTTGEVDAFEITFRFPGGIYVTNAEGFFGGTVKFGVEYRPWGSGAAWSQIISKSVSAKTRGPVKAQLRVDGLDRSKYEIRVSRLTQDDVSESYVVSVSTSEVYAISEVTYSRQSHPGLAMVGLKQVPSAQFNTSVPQAYTFLVEGFNDIREYTDESTYTTGFSRNPFWCLAHFITHPIIGLGDRYDWSNIDLPSFLAAAAYADELVADGKGGTEKRCLFDHVFDTYQPAQDVLQTFLQGSGALLVLWGDKWRIVLDEPDSMVWQGTMANIVKGSFRQEWLEKASRANRLQAVYSDAEYDYQRESAQVALPTLGQGDYYVDGSREMWGVTRRTQVERELTRYLLHNEYGDRKVELEAGLDALRVTPGSVFGVSMPIVGAGIASGMVVRVFDESTEYLEIDETVTLEAGKDYFISVQHVSNAAISRKKVINNPGDTRRIYVEGGSWDGALAVGDTYGIGETEIIKYRCLSSTLTPTFRRKIVGLKYDEDVYDFDLSVVPNPTAPDIPDPRLLSPDASTLSLYERQEYAQDGTLIDVIDVDWVIPVSAILDYFEIWVRSGDVTAWSFAGESRDRHFELKPIATDTTYEVAVVSVSTVGRKRKPGDAPSRTITTTGSLDQPPTLSGLQAHIIDGTLVATVDPVSAALLGARGYYEWRVGSTWAQSVLIDTTTNPRLETRSYARGSTVVLVKAVNSVGNKSPSAASVSISLYGQIEENVILEQSEAPSWGGTMTGLMVDENDKLTLYEPQVAVVYSPPRPADVRAARFFSFGFPPPTTKTVLLGYYTTAPITVSAGDLVRARADVSVDFSPISIGLGTFEDADFAFEDPEADIPFSGDEPDKVTITIESRFSTTDTAESSWSSWVEHRQRAEISMKYIQFRLKVEVESDAYSVEISEMDISIDLPDKVQTGIETVASATSFSVTYPTSYFVEVKRLLTSAIGGAAGDTVRVTAQDATGFTAEIRDSGGSLTTGAVHWEARGY